MINEISEVTFPYFLYLLLLFFVIKSRNRRFEAILTINSKMSSLRGTGNNDDDDAGYEGGRWKGDIRPPVVGGDAAGRSTATALGPSLASGNVVVESGASEILAGAADLFVGCDVRGSDDGWSQADGSLSSCEGICGAGNGSGRGPGMPIWNSGRSTMMAGLMQSDRTGTAGSGTARSVGTRSVNTGSGSTIGESEAWSEGGTRLVKPKKKKNWWPGKYEASAAAEA